MATTKPELSTETDSPSEQAQNEGTFAIAQTGLARSAVLLSIGNIASRILGLVREMVIGRTFALADVSAFTVASQVPTLLYDLLIGGMLSAALVPVLSDYVARGRKELAQLVSILFVIFSVILALLTLALYLLAPQLTHLLTRFDKTDPALLLLTTTLIRQISPAIWLFSMAGLLTAVLYALRRFTWPALATALYNLGIVIAAPLLAPRIGISSLVIGILLGAAAQFFVMAWDLRRVGLPLRFSYSWRHPALRRILTLYLPIAVGLIVALFQVGLDRRLASGTMENSIAWMRYATTMQQLPLGLISVAISLASLPRLSQFFAAGDETAYRQTLGRGLRMVLLFVLPAGVLLWLLGEPIVRLLYGSSQLTAYDVEQVVAALHVYLIGMLFAAVDFPLNYAFYARQNTLLPALVGIGSVFCYIVVAFWLLPHLSYLGLVWADTAKQASHALVMILLLYWRVGRLQAGVHLGVGQMVLAAAFMALVIAGLQYLLGNGLWREWQAQPWGNVIVLVIAGGGGGGIYTAILYRLRLPEVMLIESRIRARLS